MNIITVEEHNHILKHLVRLDIKECTLYHFDAHIDVAFIENKIIDEITKINNFEDLGSYEEEVWYKNTGKKGYHCGNFLYLAIKMNIISRFIWIMPNGDLRGCHGIFRYLVTKLGGINETEFLNIKYSKDEISAVLYGIEFKVITIESLSRSVIYENNVIDIDIDYLFNLSNKINWISPKVFISSIKDALKKSDIVFICKSIISGHTPKGYEFFTEYIINLINNKDSNVQDQIFDDLQFEIGKRNIDNMYFLEKDSVNKALLLINSINKPKYSEIYDEISKINNNYIKAMVLMLYDEKEALKLFELDKDCNMSYWFNVNFSKCLVATKREEEALEVLENLLKQYDDWNLKYLIGTNYLLLDKYSLSLEFLTSSLIDNPICPNTYLNLAKCYNKIGDSSNTNLALKKYKYFK
jgi:tetratricopeptide (TPR) repeat protein